MRRALGEHRRGLLGVLQEVESRSTIDQVQALFRSPHAVLVGWAHYLAFDLFVGSWEVRDSQRLKIPHWQVVPCLLFTLMVGPVGLVLYLTLRRFTRGHWVLSAQP